MPDGFEVMKLGEIVAQLPSDPDNTMFLSIDRKELGMLLFGLHFVYNMFPELRDTLQELSQKIHEVGEEQDFIGGFGL